MKIRLVQIISTWARGQKYDGIVHCVMLSLQLPIVVDTSRIVTQRQQQLQQQRQQQQQQYHLLKHQVFMLALQMKRLKEELL